MGQATITFTGLDSKKPKATSAISFVSWQQRPMQQERVVEYTTRLGGSQLIISNVKNESPASSVLATLSSNAADVTAAVKALETAIKTLRDNIGTRFTFTDENGIVIERCYIVNMTYNIKAVDGGAKAIANLQMTVMTDVAPQRKK